jgi:putative copper resistance protein D
LPGGPAKDAVLEPCRRLISWSAFGFVFTQLSYLGADSAILAGTAGLRLSEMVGANFFLSGLAGVLVAGAIAAVTARTKWTPTVGLLAYTAVVMGALVMTSHAAARLEYRATLILLTASHQAAAASWVGSMPYLVLALARSPDSDIALRVCNRFSRLAVIGVAILIASGAAMSLAYVGSADAVYGTTYGAMIASKVALLGILLFLGAANFLIVRKPESMAAWLLPRLRRFAEAEVGIGFTVILAAASLTSQPPAADLRAGRVSAAEIAERMSPRWPHLDTPRLSELSPATPLGFNDAERKQPGLQSFVPGASYSPNTPGDIAWSEYNHHWAGLIVLSAGVLAVLARSGAAGWARNWPLAFLGLAVFLFLRADPENWPLGPRSFWQSFAVADVLQHRLFVLLIVAFAGFEWGVQTGRITSPRAGLIFPLVCATGGALLLTHSHSLGNIKEELLAELSHIPLAIFGVTAGWARWLELRLTGSPRRVSAWIWPVCFVLIGIVLLNYRES